MILWVVVEGASEVTPGQVELAVYSVGEVQVDVWEHDKNHTPHLRVWLKIGNAYTQDPTTADADLLAHAPGDLAYLLDVDDRLEAENAELRAEVAGLTEEREDAYWALRTAPATWTASPETTARYQAVVSRARLA